MSFVDKAFKNVCRAVGKVVSGTGRAVVGTGQIVKGVATLDLKKTGEGFCNVAGAGLTMARVAIERTPAATAANLLLDGAVNKTLDRVQARAEKVVHGVAAKVTDGAQKR